MAKYIQVFTLLLLIVTSCSASPQDGAPGLTDRHFLTTASYIKLLLVNNPRVSGICVGRLHVADGTILRTDYVPTLMPALRLPRAEPSRATVEQPNGAHDVESLAEYPLSKTLMRRAARRRLDDIRHRECTLPRSRSLGRSWCLSEKKL